jgi:hypothetical protein
VSDDPSDREALFDREIAPLLRAAHERCRELGYPLFSTAQYDVDHWASYCWSDGSDGGEAMLLAQFHYRNRPDVLRDLGLGAVVRLNLDNPPAPKPVGDA